MAAAAFPSVLPSAALSPFPDRPVNPLLRRPYFPAGLTSIHKPSLRSCGVVARFGFHPGSFSDPNLLFERLESVVYTIADAAVANSDVMDSATTTTTTKNNDWFSGITNYMESILKVLKDVLSTLHVPYSYGFAIILLTIIVKAATFPLTRKQVESGMAMRSLQPQVKAIQERYAGDQEKIQLETARVYKLAGVNPLAGCLPTLLTIPIWIGLYRAFSNVADEGLLTEGFFWIPSLSGPTTIAARQSGGGISWLFPFVDGHPPLGWSDTLAYLVLPVLLVLSQYVSIEIMQSSQPQSNDPNVKNSQAITKFLPLMIGYFSLSVPSGLSLYWFTNNVLSTLQQVWLQKLGGAKNPVKQLNDDLIKKVKTEIEKPNFDMNSMKATTAELKSTSATTVKEEKSTPEGLRPGERFKRLKEEEARRREEEKRKAEEASSHKATVLNGVVNGQDTTKDEKLATQVDAENQLSPNGNVIRKEEQQSDEEQNQKETIES
ncbi:ALBINO3-like protein 1, chloroplastic [Linum grandiflorum]